MQDERWQQLTRANMSGAFRDDVDLEDLHKVITMADRRGLRLMEDRELDLLFLARSIFLVLGTDRIPKPETQEINEKTIMDLIRKQFEEFGIHTDQMIENALNLGMKNFINDLVPKLDTMNSNTKAKTEEMKKALDGHQKVLLQRLAEQNTTIKGMAAQIENLTARVAALEESGLVAVMEAGETSGYDSPRFTDMRPSSPRLARMASMETVVSPGMRQGLKKFADEHKKKQND